MDLELREPLLVQPSFSMALSDLYVVGGRQRAQRPLSAGNQDWNGYDQATIVQLNAQTGAWQPCVQYASPVPVIAEQDPAITFQAGYVEGDQLYVCTQTEVMIYRLPDFERLWYLTLPCFNDVHHIRPGANGTVLVANAGLEMVLELGRSGEIVREWNVLGEAPWQKFSRQVDYRRISTKPHRAHPNYLFTFHGQLWVTRFHQGDIVCLDNPEKRIQLSAERVHDGVVYDGLVYVTTVTGRVIVANPQTLQVEDVIDLTALHEPDVLLGWCRGLALQDGQMWVGFSRIRPTKFRENVGWIMSGFKRAMPTHIGLYDLKARRCVREIDLEPFGLGAVYSIFPAFRGE